MNNPDEIIITVRNLKVGYGENVILQNINFEVREGEVFVILGGSGSGKSTLLKNLIGLYPPLQGEVWIEGDNLIAAQGDERREVLRKFGVTYQSGALFPAGWLLRTATSSALGWSGSTVWRRWHSRSRDAQAGDT